VNAGPVSIDLSGKVAVVTGAAAGIGRATALTLAAYGADLAACDRDVPGLESLVAECPTKCETAALDVRDIDAVQGFASDVGATYGGVDILVNNAGGTFVAGFQDLSPKGDETLIRENLLSAVWVTRAFLDLLRDNGAIINVTTIEAHRAAPLYSVYAAAKAGLENLTRTLALELGGRGIRVNSVAPDVIATPGVGDFADAATLPPLGRPGRAEEVATVIAFLASDLASYVTGSTVHVDGGNLAAAGWRANPDGGWSP
jgi:NAD(P)-dependent dehydrogenase (short-subunit alcohol dehydrogenase family)